MFNASEKVHVITPGRVPYGIWTRDSYVTGPVMRSVANPIAPGVVSSILTRRHTFVEIDRVSFSTAFLLLLR